MPRYEPRDETDDSLSSSPAARLPRRPRPALTAQSSYDSSHARSPGTTPYRATRRSARTREEASRSRHPPRALSPLRRQHERRESRRAPGVHGEERKKRRSVRDPEREQRRQERAARDPESEARRRERRATRRAERHASRSVDAKAERHPAPVERSPPREAVSLEEDHTGRPDRDTSPDSAPDNTPPTEIAADEEDSRDHPLSYRDSYPLPRYHSNRRRHAEPDGHASNRLLPEDHRQYPRGDWDTDLESSFLDEKVRPHSGSNSTFSELEWYKRGTIANGRHYYRKEERSGCCGFSRLCSCITLIVTTLIALIIIIAVAVTVSKKNQSRFTPSTLQVNETAAFESGAATRNSVSDTKDGIGAGRDVYTLYEGTATKMLAEVPSSKWISFEDMWNNNLETLQNACGWLKYGENDTPEEIVNIYNAIQDRANASLVDHRLILAFILQESKGCVHTPATTSSGGVTNTGLFQAHHGHEYNPRQSAKSILEMVQDGTQGTKKGNGLVQELNAYYGNPYAAARAYNSGFIPPSGELTEAAGATKCYVSDIANRLTGWVKAESSCSDSGH